MYVTQLLYLNIGCIAQSMKFEFHRLFGRSWDAIRDDCGSMMSRFPFEMRLGSSSSVIEAVALSSETVISLYLLAMVG
jgi:hypothetical protein